ncbi:Fe-S protein assembly co-chaperone HscB [Mergibacter septicus]|uniref:Fe-S protein assembly co-chaperone HscB n=1 Tax=Mergibacter septicus TaxID=221402 RepID=UPI00117981F4|nr:Fe-S protein assembly co-chaperone HscB [Mergibacter septicus]AWX14173.1 Fe-S protein assembly co-chaperone HscB [Mergibacter septicus]
MQTPFDIFELAVEFDLNLEQLSQRYLALQKNLHPDNFTATDEQQQRLALQRSSQINDAYQILKDPISRAEAILAIGTQQAVATEQTNQDLTFLMQQMAWREQLEALEQQAQSTDISAQLNSLQQDVEELQQQQTEQLRLQLAQKQWETVKQIIDRLKFIKKLQQEIERLEEKLFDF